LEKRLLQIVIGLGAVIAVLIGARGVVHGPAIAGASSIELGAESHYRFLSGLLAGLGAAYTALIPAIEREGQRLFLLTLVVVVAGFARAAEMLVSGPEGLTTYFSLLAALVAAPAVYLWQGRVARRALMDAPPARG
jgi:hypothetical protein